MEADDGMSVKENVVEEDEKARLETLPKFRLSLIITPSWHGKASIGGC